MAESATQIVSEKFALDLPKNKMRKAKIGMRNKKLATGSNAPP